MNIYEKSLFCKLGGADLEQKVGVIVSDYEENGGMNVA